MAGIVVYCRVFAGAALDATLLQRCLPFKNQNKSQNKACQNPRKIKMLKVISVGFPAVASISRQAHINFRIKKENLLGDKFGSISFI